MLNKTSFILVLLVLLVGNTIGKNKQLTQVTSTPVANFTFESLCGGSFFFRDSSLNNPTQWTWEFGDGSFSTQQNPTHNYALAGTYQVKLIVNSLQGTDSILKTVLLNTLLTPLPAPCFPSSKYSSIGYIIKDFVFNTIHKVSEDSLVLYIDNSCTYNTTVLSGQTYPISITILNSQNMNVGAWIDYNNDGTFDENKEKVFNSNSSTLFHTGNITIPTTAITNFPLRMRIGSETPNYLNSIDACNNVNQGQFQDFAIIIQPSSLAPKAGFSYSLDCDGTTTFTDSTFINCATSWYWDFGDSSFSTSQNPIHKYSNSGNYSAKLKVCNSISCDSITKNIQTATISGLKNINCKPITTNSCCRTGIRKVQLNTINQTSGNASEGYKDFTCNSNTTLIAGSQIPVKVLTDSIGFENVKIWIDFDNDGLFNNATEQVFQSDNKQLTHSGVINTSKAFILNTPLRMRVCDDTTTVVIQDACSNLSRGQAEDYAVIFVANSQLPVAAFTSDYTTVCNGTSISFTDISQNNPSSWQWYFTGGTPNVSNSQNPTITYNVAGNYPVTLVVSNANGQDSIVKVAYIRITNGASMCNSTFSNAPSGSFYDSGGPSGNYTNTANCTFLISPVCATSITLTITQFGVAYNSDYLYIYNGSNSSAPLLASGTGGSIPTVITANSGKMYIVFQNSSNGNYVGWNSTWTSQQAPTNAVVASFTSSSTNPAFGTEVQFTDQTTNLPSSWVWDFGDGQASLQKNTSHNYLASGTYKVTLNASNCVSTDTFSQTITVQDVPSIEVTPDSVNLTLSCGDSITLPFTIRNKGISDLNIETDFLKYATDTVQVLAFVGIANFQGEFSLILNMINYQGGFKKYKITQHQSLLPQDLEIALKGKDVLLFPSHFWGSGFNNYPALSSIVNDFISSGKIVIVLGSTFLNKNSRVYEMGLFNGQFISKMKKDTQTSLPIQDTTSLITQGFSNPISVNSYSTQFVYNHRITNTDKKILLLNYQNDEVLTYRAIGKGLVYNFGYDFTDYFLGRAVLNIFKSAKDSLPEWVSVPSNKVTLHPGDSLVVNFTVSSKGLHSGFFTKTIFVHSNDTAHSTTAIPISLNVTSPPTLELNKTCLNFDPIMNNLKSKQTFKISNNGCDTLKISSLQFSNNAFSAVASSFDIPSGKSKEIEITFQPPTDGIFNGDLHILNNFNGDSSICLTGIGEVSPTLSYQPLSLSATLLACSDSTNLSAYIHNKGDVNLNYNIKAPVKILAIVNLVDLASEFKNTIKAISNYNTNFRIDTLTYTTDSLLKIALVNHEILLFPEMESADYWSANIYAQLRTRVLDFVNKGGRVIVLGSAVGQYRYPIRDLGLMDAYLYGGNVAPFYISQVDTSNILMKGVPAGFYGVNASYRYYKVDTTIVTLAGSGLYYDYVMYKKIGLGDAVFIGFDYYESNAATERIIANAVDIYTNGFPSWLSATPLSGTIIPGDSALISLTLKSDGYSAGSYLTNLYFSSNDPFHPLDSLPITLNVLQNPCADFNFAFNTCNGHVNFNDVTFNNPTAFTWDFGDGQFSNQQNPSHTYTSVGTYQVKLVACTSYSCDSITKSVTINSLIGPDYPDFIPLSNMDSYNQYGIKNVELNSIHHNDTSTYKVYNDYSCSDTTTLIAGELYPIRIDTKNYELVGVWIDFNDDMVFDTLNEVVYRSYNSSPSTSGNIIIPATTVLNKPLRLRVVSDNYMTLPNPNINPQLGEFEDYAVIIQANQSAPKAKFYYNQSCAGNFSFIDSSLHFPVTWFWDFGDGNTSTLENPTHIYATTGTYNIKLLVCNSFGCDSISDTITIATLSNTKVTSCNSATTSYQLYRDFGISRLIFNTINKISLGAIVGYEDFSCSDITTVFAGLKYPISVFGMTNTYTKITAWIDWNNDGNLDSISELVLSKTGYNVVDSIYIPGDAIINNQLRFRISGAENNYLVINPCRDLTTGQAEDYSIIIQSNPFPLACNYSFEQQSACNGTVVFKDSSTNIPTSWYWDFGDGTTSTLEKPTHNYTSIGAFNVKLVVCKPNYCDSITKTIIINSLSGPKNIDCRPIRSSSTPYATSTRVRISTLDKTSLNSPFCYQDFTCTDSTQLVLNTDYYISIETSYNRQESASAWIDYNNDGSFDVTTELILATNHVYNHGAYFRVPLNAVTDTPLRLRIAVWPGYGSTSPCAQFYEIEDFKITIKPEPPKTYFSFSQTCNGYLSFKDSTLHNPTSWLWNFGDSTYSNLQNPTHNYSSPGVYTIKLVSCNSNRCDSTSKIINISNVFGPMPVSCTPKTTTYCCGIGITNVTLNTLNKTSLNGSEGYKDFSCTNSTTLQSGQTYNISITTNTVYFENVKVWMDFNNDGNFNATTELVFSSINRLLNHNGTITIPSNVVLNTTIRMRVGDDLFSASLPSPCNDATFGQFEDYSIIFTSIPPIANFTYNQSCSNSIAFVDTSINFPTSWQWNFGDGTTSNIQNPTHTFLTNGTYQINLLVCNMVECDSIIDSITINNINTPIPPVCIPSTISNCCGIGIKNLTFNDINKSSLDASEGYSDFSCTDSTVITNGTNYPIFVTTGSNLNENVSAWIDFNNDGIFNPTSELIFNSINQLSNHSGNVYIPANVLLNTKLRMRVGDELNSVSMPDACSNPIYGQYEDYSITILPNTLPPTANFSSSTQGGCNDIAYFTDSSLNVPTDWKWKFGDGDSSSSQYPSHQYSSDGIYLVELIVSNLYGADTISKTITISTFSDSIIHTGNLISGQPILFSNTVANAVSYYWNFGDGHIAISSSPIHTYSSAGTYIISLIINSGNCIDTIFDTLNIISTVGILELQDLTSFRLYPNPFFNELELSFNLTLENRVSLNIYNAMGQIVKDFENESLLKPGQYKYIFETSIAGIYYVKCSFDGNTKIYKIVNIN